MDTHVSIVEGMNQNASYNLENPYLMYSDRGEEETKGEE